MTFKPQKYLNKQKKKNIEMNQYYAVNYGKVYIGRVMEISKASVKMTFMERKPANSYNWLKNKQDIDNNVPVQYIFCWPNKYEGVTPFHIEGVDEAYKQYLKFKTASLLACFPGSF